MSAPCGAPICITARAPVARAVSSIRSRRTSSCWAQCAATYRAMAGSSQGESFEDMAETLGVTREPRRCEVCQG
jgi:hypothetical protein